jgi:long-chain acyl-CoA synthetase
MSESVGLPNTGTGETVASDVGVAPKGERTFAANPAQLAEGTIVELFMRAVDEFDKPDAFLRRGASGWEPFSHREVLEHVHALYAGLATVGVRRGDPVALLSENRLEWALTDYALLCRGAPTVPIYPTLPAEQVQYLLADSEARVLFVSTAEQLAKALEARRETAIETIVVFDDVASPVPGVRTLADLLEAGRAAAGSENEFRMDAQSAQPHDLATLLYTSGTTGRPKGVMLTHNNLHSNVVAGVGVLPVGPADVALSFLPLSHVFQRVVDYGMFAYGCTIAHMPSIDDVARAFQEVRPTIAAGVPRVYEKVYARILAERGLKGKIVHWARDVALRWARATLAGRSPGLTMQIQHAFAERLVYTKVRDRLGGRIRFFISGSAPLNPEIAYFFYGAGVQILEGYGLTETSPVTNVNTPNDLRIGTVGKPIPGTEIRIAEDGEILIRGPQVMKGYFKNPEATRTMIDAEGWLYTGDIGTLDADGFLRITDRKKELIKTAGGKYIAPQPIENAAKRSGLVAESLVLGDRRPYAILLVVPDFGALEAWARGQGIAWQTHDELVALPRVRAKIEEEALGQLDTFARYERPKRVLPLPRELSIEAGEITPSMKVKRRVVEEHFRAQIDALYAESTPARAGGDGG